MNNSSVMLFIKTRFLKITFTFTFQIFYTNK
jgi:hypothetical protein